MQHRVTRALAAAGFSFLFALTAACGGSAPEAKAPGADPTDAPRVGSSAPDPASDSSGTAVGTDAPKPTVAAVVSADNGSDIIPPFSSSKEPAKKSSSAKGSKKGAKPKKKG